MIGNEMPQLMAYTPNTSTSIGFGDSSSFNSFKSATQNQYLFQAMAEQYSLQPVLNKPKEKVMPETKKPTCRVVRIFIVDADENMPLEKAVLFKGDEQLTNLTDDELFLEIGIKPLLDTHNKNRAAVVDKKASQRSGKDVFLEPIRIRDLKMVVSCIAEF